MARMLGKGTVLPDLPYTADMPSFDEVSLTRDTLPAHNARELITQGLTQVGPRPAAPVINMPQIAIPESKPMSEYETLMDQDLLQHLFPPPLFHWTNPICRKITTLLIMI